MFLERQLNEDNLRPLWFQDHKRALTYKERELPQTDAQILKVLPEPLGEKEGTALREHFQQNWLALSRPHLAATQELCYCEA